MKTSHILLLSGHFVLNLTTLLLATDSTLSTSAVTATQLSGATTQTQTPSVKKRIAVFSFDDKSNNRASWWRSDESVGQGISDMCITALLKTGKYAVIERTQLEQVFKEQALGQTGALSEESVAEAGKLLGAEIALFGAVTEFAYDEKTTGGSPVRTPFGFTNISIGVKKTTARIVLNARLVNTTTGEILAAVSVPEEESKGGFSISKANLHFENQSSFNESLMGKATNRAVETLVSRIDAQVAAIKWNGCIVKSDLFEIIINGGSATGVKIGDTLTIYSKGEEFIDPASGLSLGCEEKKVGTIVVVADMLQGKASKCFLRTGSGGARGDLVRY